MQKGKDTLFFMQEALKEAQMARERGEVPVGALITSGERILSRAHNSTIFFRDATAHAEIIAIRRACQEIQNHRLGGCDLYVTLEPCSMCMGAAVQARVGRLFFGAYDPKSGACGTVFDFPFDRLNHRLNITGGILEDECGRILKDFFQQKR